MVVISLHTKEGNLVEATLENTLIISTYPQCIFSVQAATQKGAKINFNGSSAELITPNGTCLPIKQQGHLYYNVLLYTVSTMFVVKPLKCGNKMLGHCHVANIKKLEG